MECPCAANDYQAAHVELLMRSYTRLTGRNLIPPAPDSAKVLFEAPFFVASHSLLADPILTYGNCTALELFEMSWDEFTTTPSRFTAEAPRRDERARLLEAVRTHGFIDDYSGIRISSTGQRFKIERATVWNLISDNGDPLGQAATFDSWVPVG